MTDAELLGTDVPTLEETRRLLGEAAQGLSDTAVLELRDGAYRFASAVVPVVRSNPSVAHTLTPTRQPRRTRR
jgi:hypothetical protein